MTASVAAVCLLLFMALAHGRSPSQAFLLEDGGLRHTVTIFANNMRHRQQLHLRYTTSPDSDYAGTESVAFMARGQRCWLRHLDDHQHLAVSLSGGRNPLWPRWRYAHLTNLTLNLTNQAPTRLPPGATVTLPCTIAPDQIVLPHVFCQIGDSVRGLPLVTDASDGKTLGQYLLALDPDRVRSSLPPELYFLLTNGRARWRRLDNNPNASLAEADPPPALESANCIDVLGLRICQRDMPHFDFSGVAERQAIIIGSSFWLSNTSQTVIDGVNGEVTLVLGASVVTGSGNANTTILYWADVILAIVIIALVYGRWLGYPATPSVGMVLWHLYEWPQLKQRGRRGIYERWVLDMRMTINLLACIASGIVVSLMLGLGYQQFPVMTSEGPYWQLLVLGLLCYGWAQTLLAFILALTLSTPASGLTLRVRLQAMQTAPLPIAWLRHCMQGTAAMAFATTLITLVAQSGASLGSVGILALLVVPTLVVVWHHTYYGVAALGFACSRLPSLTRRRAETGKPTVSWELVAALAAIELLLLGGLLTVLAFFYLDPLVNVSSPYFDENWNFLLALTLLAAVIVTACIWIASELRIVLTKVRRSELLLQKQRQTPQA